jgi:hypothetical protein
MSAVDEDELLEEELELELELEEALLDELLELLEALELAEVLEEALDEMLLDEVAPPPHPVRTRAAPTRANKALFFFIWSS